MLREILISSLFIFAVVARFLKTFQGRQGNFRKQGFVYLFMFNEYLSQFPSVYLNGTTTPFRFQWAVVCTKNLFRSVLEIAGEKLNHPERHAGISRTVLDIFSHPTFDLILRALVRSSRFLSELFSCYPAIHLRDGCDGFRWFSVPNPIWQAYIARLSPFSPYRPFSPGYSLLYLSCLSDKVICDPATQN